MPLHEASTHMGPGTRARGCGTVCRRGWGDAAAPLERQLLRIETVGALVDSAVDGRVGLLPLPVASERAERCQEEEDQDQNDDPAVHGFLRAVLARTSFDEFPVIQWLSGLLNTFS